MLKAGFSSRCITPGPGQEIPGLFERRWAVGVHDDLFVRAAVVDDGTACAAFVQCDAVAVTEALVAEARREAQRLCGVPAAHCFIAATHTHSGGPVVGAFLSEEDPAYAALVAREIGVAVAEAHRLRRAVLAGVEADAACGFAFNRRFHMKDGTALTHPGKMNPEILEAAGPEDPTVTVVGFCDPKTRRPLGCLVHFACHATHMNGVLYSADYPKWVIDTLRAVHGPDFGVVFLNGAFGDVTQVDNRSGRPAEFGPYWCERMGRGIGGGAIQALARMDYYTKASVAVASVKPRGAIRQSTAQERRAARDLLKRKAITAEDVETIYARELLEVEKMRRKAASRRIEIMGVRIADALFWGVPAEFFQAHALEVQMASPFPHCCCVGLANGYNGYICTEDAFAGGGYEVRTARSSFLVPEVGGRVVAAAKRLSKGMFTDAETEIGRLPARKTWPAFSDDQALDGISQLTSEE